MIRSARSERRLHRALEWLLSRPPATDLLVVGASLEAAHELLLRGAKEVGAAFGWRRTTLDLLARDLTAVPLALDGLVRATGLGAEAVITRVVAELGAEGRLGAFGRVADTPGFVRALADSLSDLRHAGLAPADVEEAAPEAARILARYSERLAEEGLADRAGVLQRAAAVARDAGARHMLLGLPTLFLDVPLRSEIEVGLAAAVAARAPDALFTVPRGDARTLAHLEEAPGIGATDLDEDGRSPSPALARLQARLFEESVAEPLEAEDGGREGIEREGAGETTAPEAPRAGSLELFSAPGENRECVEIARKVLRYAGDGIPFDGMAILLRSPEEYRAHLREALARARIPVWFERGILLPDPAGRAFLALLRCREEGYSAKRFAEYLSLGEVPDATAEGAPPPEASPEERWAPAEEEGREPRSELARPELARPEPARAGTRPPGEAGDPRRPAAYDPAVSDPAARPVLHGTLRAPRRWERLIVEASVVGGLDRWRRRLKGLRAELAADLEALEREEDPGARIEGVRRDLRDLAHLEGYALPLLEALEALPARAAWETWLDRLSALASRSLRDPARVLSLLTELAPLGPVGPVDLAEVIRVLSRHLLELSRHPEGLRFGKLFVGSTEEARGRRFDVAFVPGLAERLFPLEIREDPVLLDGVRTRIAGGRGNGSARPSRLPLNEDRIAEERLALHLAVGSATRRVVLSFPRMDLSRSRPRVPSFYALEALRAAEGRLPLFETLRERADAVTEARVGWPAPRRRREAIDEAEYDLAVLEAIHGRPFLGGRRFEGEKGGKGGGARGDGRGTGAPGAGEPGAAGAGTADVTGLARYLLTANPHLGRALRARGFRWSVRKWSRHDGFVDPSAAAAEALARYRLTGADARPVSATALQTHAVCPYKFYLSTVHRLEPRTVPEPVDTLDPLQKGSLVHDTMFEVFSRLEADGLLPVTPEKLEACLDRLDGAVDDVAGEYRERLVPAIDRVWEDGIEAIRADLRRWLRDVARAEGGWVPWRFELSFGLSRRRGPADPHSHPDPVALEAGIRLRGAIDLVERRGDGALRVTDYKTGRVRVKEGAVTDGGRHLQPVLYPLAVEKLVPGARVVSGRLYYCTADGGFHVHEVPLDEDARRALERVVELTGEGIAEGFLPAAPDEGACRWCDYLPVCGPREERRAARKERSRLVPLLRLRELR